MSLHYLSDDEISGRADRKKRRAKKKAKRKTKKAARKTRRATKKGERKSGTRPKRIARIALAPSRAAFLVVVRMNVGKIATKLVRVYKKKGGKEKLQQFWIKFGGKKWKTFTGAVSKGAKQRIAADEMGIALEAALAAAVPVLIVAYKIVKSFKAEGGDDEQKEFDDMIMDGKRTLASSDDFETGTAMMDEDEDVAVLQDADDYPDDDDDLSEGSFFSMGLLFKLPLMLSIMGLENTFLIAIATVLSTYCIVGIPFHILAPNSKLARLYFSPLKPFGYGKKELR